MVMQSENKIKAFQFDNGGQLNSHIFWHILNEDVSIALVLE